MAGSVEEVSEQEIAVRPSSAVTGSACELHQQPGLKKMVGAGLIDRTRHPCDFDGHSPRIGHTVKYHQGPWATINIEPH
jgi:hypothetical protein